MRELLSCRFVRAAAVVALVHWVPAQAGVYRCVGADGTLTFSDKACEQQAEQPAAAHAATPPANTLGAARDVPVVSGDASATLSSLDRKIHELLLLTQLSARESPGLAEVAHDLVPRIDPNLGATPQDPRWPPLSRAIQADIRADMPQLAHAFADADQALLRSLDSRIQEADADALLSFFRSPTGVSYLQFLGDMRAIYASAVRSVLGHVADQTPIAQSGASAGQTQNRLRLIALAAGAASLFHAQDAAHNVRDPSAYAADGILPQQIAAVTGPGLDSMLARYESALPEFESLNASAPAKRFFASVARPIEAKTLATEAAMRDFSDAELEKYGGRWRVAYRRGIYYVAVVPGEDLGIPSSGGAPQIRRATYASPRNGRSFDITHTLQGACSRGGDTCKIACGNQLAGDPDFGQVKYCQIAFQCGSHAVQNVSLSEGRNVTLACSP